ADRLDRASEALRMRKKDIVAGLVSKYLGTSAPTLGSYSVQPYEAADPHTRRSSAFQPHEPADRPEVMDPEHAAEFLQIEPATVVDLAEAGKLPGRKIGKHWRFSRAALVAWLSGPEKR